MGTEHDMEPDKPLRSMDLESAQSNPRSCGAILRSSVAKTVSAGLFLFDVLTNIVVLREYYILRSEGSYKGAEIYDDYPVFQKAVFYICLGIMLVDPVLTAMAFKLKLQPEERPLRSAMFLPIVQFLRFVRGLFRTCSCARAVETTESEETEALHAITVANQTGPQLLLQTSVILWVSLESYDVSRKPSTVLVLSIVISFLSACYNSGRACMYQISDKWSLIPNLAGIAGGLYTVGVVLLRCTVMVSLVLEGSDFLYLVLYLVLGIGMCSYVNALLVAFSKRRTMCSWATQAEILWNTYNSACIGPLYPIVENDNQKSCNNRLRRWSVSVGIALGVAVNIFPDVVFLLIVILRKLTSCNNNDSFEEVKFIFSCSLFKSYAAFGFLLSILPSVALYFIAKRTSPRYCTRDLNVNHGYPASSPSS